MKLYSSGGDVQPITAKSEEIIRKLTFFSFRIRGEQLSPVLPSLLLFTYRGVSLPDLLQLEQPDVIWFEIEVPAYSHTLHLRAEQKNDTVIGRCCKS